MSESGRTRPSLSPTPASEVGILAVTDIPCQAIAGPYPINFSLDFQAHDSNLITCVLEIQWNGQVVMDNDQTNQWMIYIQPARDRHEQNVEVFMNEKDEFYLRFIREVKAGEHIYVWYQDELARSKSIPILKPENIRGNQEYMCTTCQKIFKFPNSLKSHIRFKCPRSRNNGFKTTITPSTDYSQNMWTGSDFRSISAFTQIPPRLEVPPYKSGSTFIHNLHDMKRISTLPTIMTSGTPSEQALNLSKREILQSSSHVNVPNVSQPIQIFNHIHTPAYPIAIDNNSFRLYHHHHSLLNHPYSSASRMCCGQMSPVHHHVIDGRESCLSSYDRNYLSPSPGANRHSPSQLAYNFPLPSDKQGEPLDLLPKSLYTSKSRRGHLCIYCGKLYSRKYGLKIHLRTHTGYKPLKCKVCLRPFGDPSNLNKHVRLHAEGETPYKCQFCGKVLVRRRDLERHIKSRHPDQSIVKTENDADSSTLDSSLDDGDSDSAETDSEIIVS